MCTAGFHRSLLELLDDNVFSCVGVRIYLRNEVEYLRRRDFRCDDWNWVRRRTAIRRERRESAFTNLA